MNGVPNDLPAAPSGYQFTLDPENFPIPVESVVPVADIQKRYYPDLPGHPRLPFAGVDRPGASQVQNMDLAARYSRERTSSLSLDEPTRVVKSDHQDMLDVARRQAYQAMKDMFDE
ncbi:hypothetical protein C8J56DRAFT_1041970 [Mycena floridula]|nr:hypothetical protein C8J56DRAFT_1041970 [Mycena floridula]